MYIHYPATGGVLSINGLTGAVTLAAGTNITITPSGNTLTISSTDTGVTTMAPVGSAPNANGAVIAGTTLTLEPADGSNPGVLTSGIQVIGGAKQFNANMGIGVAAQANRVLTINPTGATTGISQYGCFVDYITDNTATSTAYGFYGVVRTPASAFTCNLAASVVGDAPVAGAGSTISHFANFKCFESAVATNNAILVDGSTFTGNYAIKLVSVNPSQLAGQISAGGGTAASTAIIAVTPTAAQNVLTGTTQRAFRATMEGTTASTVQVNGFSSAPVSAAATALRSYFAADSVAIGTGSATRDVNYYMAGITSSGTNNAGISDNNTFTGNWGINLSSSNKNLLTGPTAIGGTTTNDSAAAGFVGEYVESVISSTTSVPGATTVWANLTSISLTAGDWEVNGVTSLDNTNSATITSVAAAISINSGTTTTDQIDGSNQVDSATPGALAIRSLVIPGYRISISGTTTVYLKMNVAYTIATPQYRCRISARRMR